MQSLAFSNSDSASSFTSGSASLHQLLERNRITQEVNVTEKSAVKNYLNSLSKMELIALIIRVLGLQDVERFQTETVNKEYEMNAGGADTTPQVVQEKGKPESSASRRKCNQPVESKTPISTQNLEHPTRLLLTKDYNNLVKGSAHSSKNVSKKERDGETEDLAPKSKNFGCKMCDFTFTSRRQYRKHIQSHVPFLNCNICNKVFKSKDSLYHHQRGLHGKEKPYHCNVCGSYFSFHHSYKLHLQRHKGERPFSCRLCPKTYLTSSHLKEHMRAAHMDSSIICHICGNKFSYSSALKLHLQTHVDDKTYSCPTCSKVFSTKRALMRHSVLHLENKRVKCNVCGKFFKSDHYLNIHSKLHSTKFEKNYKCDNCGKSFFYKCILDRHLQTHNHSKSCSFSCGICDKTFKSKASLYSHKYVHNEGLNFLCTICSKSFKTKSCLNAHTKRHLNKSTFVCSICGKTFPDKGGLSKHTKTIHLPRRIYSCKICERTGTRADNMRTHVKSHRNQVGPGEDPMNYISCVEESRLGIQPRDSNKRQFKKGEKQPGHSVPEVNRPETVTGVDKAHSESLFHGENLHSLSSASLMPASFNTSEFVVEKEINFVLTEGDGNAGNSFGNLLSGIHNTLTNHSSSCFHSPVTSNGTEKLDPSSAIMPSVISSGPQTLSRGVPSFNHNFLPGYYNSQCIPSGAVGYSEGTPTKSAQNGEVDWLTSSDLHSVTNPGV